MAALITDSLSAHQDVEDVEKNEMHFEGMVTGNSLDRDLVRSVLNAHFNEDKRLLRRFAKVVAMEIVNIDNITTLI